MRFEGRRKILYAGRDGVLLYEKSSGIHMLASEEKAAAKRILETLDENSLRERSGLLVAHGENAPRGSV